MHCTTEPGSRFSRPRKCNCCCRLSPPKPEAWEHGPSDANLRVSTRWRWNGRRMPAYRERCRSEEHTSELQSRLHLVCRLLLEKKKRSAGRYTLQQTARLHMH